MTTSTDAWDEEGCPRRSRGMQVGGADDDEAIRGLIMQAMEIEFKYQEMERTGSPLRTADISGRTGVLSRDICRSIIRTYVRHTEGGGRQ